MPRLRDGLPRGLQPGRWAGQPGPPAPAGGLQQQPAGGGTENRWRRQQVETARHPPPLPYHELLETDEIFYFVSIWKIFLALADASKIAVKSVGFLDLNP